MLHHKLYDWPLPQVKPVAHATLHLIGTMLSDAAQHCVVTLSVDGLSLRMEDDAKGLQSRVYLRSEVCTSSDQNHSLSSAHPALPTR